MHDGEKLKGLAVICSPVQQETKIIINALDVAMVFTIGDSTAPKGRYFFGVYKGELIRTFLVF